MLTIAIPTFDRNQEIISIFQILLPQVQKYSEICQILIIDNNSPNPVEKSLESVLSQFKDVKVTVKKNLVNVGLSANLLRCFEFCETEWMWLLGDDDLVMDNACELVINKIKIKNNLDAHFIHFASNLGKRTKEFHCIGIDELLENIDSYDNFNFISVGIYRVAFFKEYISVAYAYDYSLSPHVVLIITGFAQQKLKAIFTNDEIVVHKRPEEEKAWSRLEFLHRLFIILELPSLNHSQRYTFYKKIIKNRRLEEYITVCYLVKAIKENNRENALYKFDHSMFRIFYYDKNLIRKIKISFYRYLFINPTLSIKIINIIYSVLNKPLTTVDENISSLKRI